MKKFLPICFALVGLLVVAAYGARGLFRRPLPDVILPEFSGLPPGPRAPSHVAFGQHIGKTSFEMLAAWTTTRGLVCKDTSARELVRRMKAKKLAEAEAKAAAQGVDAVTSASAKRKSPMERNPQIRWACENTPSINLGDHSRIDAKGRALFVFDSPEHPLRHASFRRRHRAQDTAIDDVRSTYRQLISRFGPPTAVRRPLPTQGETIPKYTPFTYTWRYADLKVVLKMVAYPGSRGIDIQEAVEVPWPIRADAPHLTSPSSVALAPLR